MSDSTTKPKKKYISGSAKAKKFENGGEVINLSIKVDALVAIKDEKGYARVTLSKLLKPDQYGNDWSISEDTWKPPTGGALMPSAPRPVQPKVSTKGSDDFPF